MKLKKKFQNSDKSRTKIYTPRECLIPTIKDGFVFVYPEKESSVRVLQRKGFEMVKPSVSEPVAVESVKKVEVAEKVGPVPNRKKKLDSKAASVVLTQEALKALTVKELLSIAKSLGVVGRHRMKEDDLIQAILIAKKDGNNE